MSNTTFDSTRVHIRWMIRRDMPEVLQLEQEQRIPWNEEHFLFCLRQRNCIGMAAEQGERVVGFMVYELHKSKLEILNMVGERWVIDRMLAKLASKLSGHRRTRIGYNVDECDTAMHLALQANGYSAVRVIRHGEDDGADSYRFVYHISAATGENNE